MNVNDYLENAQIETATRASKSVAKTGLIIIDGVPYWSDGTSWRPFGGGGASGQIQWILGDNSPTEAVDNFLDVLEFSNLNAQGIWAALHVPLDYVAGTQILIQGGKFSTLQTSGNALFKATTYLIRPGVHVMSDRSKSWKSLNASIAVNAVADTLTSLGSLDLTSSNGSVKNLANDDFPVAANDLLLVNLVREVQNEGTSAAGVVKLARYGMTPKFTV